MTVTATDTGSHRAIGVPSQAVMTPVRRSATPLGRKEACARLDKPNALGKGLSEAEMAQLREATIARYAQIAPVRRALTSLLGALEQQGEKSGWTIREAKSLAAFAREAVSLYLNPDQYHSAEHVLTMTSDAIMLAEKSNLIAGTYGDALKRVIISCLYHDAGNGDYPDLPGKDEQQSVEIFLKDVQKSRALVVGGRHPRALAALAELSDAEVLRISGNILGTVFRDRHATVDQLTNLPVDVASGQIDYVADAIRILRQSDLNTSKSGLAELMVSLEALIVKNADITASLRGENVLKNGLTNYHEDTQRAPALFRGQSSVQYRAGFNSFLRGDFHKLTHGENITPAQQQTSGGSFLLGPEVNRQYGKELTLAADNVFALYTHFDGPILDAMHALISEAHDSDNAARQSMISMPLADLKPRLIAKMNMTATQFERDYGIAFEEHGTKTIVEMSAREVNDAFGSLTSAVIKGRQPYPG